MKRARVQLATLIKNIFSSTRIFSIVLVFLLFFPLFFHGTRFGMPRVKGGDEPHYLIVINSLLNDGDLDLRNNYDSANQGSFQAGNKFMGMSLDRHTVSFINGKPVLWEEIYESFGNSEKWGRDKQGKPIPILKSGVAGDVSGLAQYSVHPSGIAFLLAPFLWAVKGTPYVEPLALFLANLAVIFSAFVFRGIVGRYTKDLVIINLATFFVFLGTPIWAYGRTLFTEPFLVLFALGAYGFTLGKKSGFWAGGCLGLGIMIKTPFALLAIPLALFWLGQKDWNNLLRFLVGPILAMVYFLCLNSQLYGSPLTPPHPFIFENPFIAAPGIWFSWNHGIFAFAPVLIPFLFSWKKFLREQRTDAWVWGGGFFVYYLLMSFFTGWSGAWSFGPREILPVIPFLMIPACYTLGEFSDWGRLRQWGFIALCLLSLAFNALGAMDGYWNSHPLMIFRGEIA